MQVKMTLTGAEKLKALKMTPEKRNGFLVSEGQAMKRIALHAWTNRADPATSIKWRALKFPPSQTNSSILQSLVAAPPHVTAGSVTIGSNKPHARIHQVGGTVNAKPGKYLAIPMRDVSEVKGKRARTWWREAERAKRRPFIHQGPKHKVILAPDASGKLKAFYLLVKSVKIPARPYVGFSKAHQAATVKNLKRWLGL